MLTYVHNSDCSEYRRSVTYSYGAMDPTARKINVAKFRAQKADTLIVTDVAARGIDIPLLDYVINFDFPTKPKLFVHRVGRVARAGRSGIAFSLVSSDEVPHMLDLHLFLGRGVIPAKPMLADGTVPQKDVDAVYGKAPQILLDLELERIRARTATTHGTGNKTNLLPLLPLRFFGCLFVWFFGWLGVGLFFIPRGWHQLVLHLPPPTPPPTDGRDEAPINASSMNLC